MKEQHDQMKNALSALAAMWNHFCPPPLGNYFMEAGEQAEEVLLQFGLLREDGTAIDLRTDIDIPDHFKEPTLTKLSYKFNIINKSA